MGFDSWKTFWASIIESFFGVLPSIFFVSILGKFSGVSIRGRLFSSGFGSWKDFFEVPIHSWKAFLLSRSGTKKARM